MNKYFHSVVLEEEKCKGCTHCMRKCPMEAIRVRDKRAIIIKERCIDCGECIIVCPYHAQNAITDDLSRLQDFEMNIAILSTTMYGQFTDNIDMNKVYQGIKNMGFDYVYDEGIAADISSIILRNIIEKEKIPKPIISSMCPAILRIIQVRFPTLLKNIVNIESPMEIAARLAKREIMKKNNIKEDNIGVFYLTPCPAKVTSIKQPIGIEKSELTGAISIKKIYGDIVSNTKHITDYDKFNKGSHLGIGWSSVGGQSKAIGIKNYISADGIDNVIDVLEEIELGKLNNIDFFEGYACIGGCVGGPLNVENPFIASSRIRKISNNEEYKSKVKDSYAMDLYKTKAVCWTNELKPKEIMQLDDDFETAVKKIEKLKYILDILPGLDCGSCGAPSCRALAEDIVRGYANIYDCMFMNDNNNDNEGG
nr:[Fe-Fe] hydrogenase large subunit C-terminal domain-containing protein [Clostridiisalibacter paucivorans]